MNVFLIAIALSVSAQVPVPSPTQLMESIGEQGAAALAAERGFEPVLLSHQKTIRQGFDQVWRSGHQVLVIEAKGGSSRLGVARGFAQASEGWTLTAARETLKRASASRAELAAAREILAAAPKGQLSVEVVRTRMKDGQLRTVVEQVVQTRNVALMRKLAAALVVAVELYVRVERALSIEVDYSAGRIDLAERDLRHLKNVGGSIGALGATGTAILLVGPQGVAASLAVGGACYLIGDRIGGLGAACLADWLHDEGISVSESCKAMASRAAVAAGSAWDWVQQSGGSAWSWTTEQGGIAWSWVRDAGTGTWNWTARWGNTTGDWTAETAGKAWDWTIQTADDTWGWMSREGQGAWQRTSRSGWEVLEAAQESGNKAWGWVHRHGLAAWKWASKQRESRESPTAADNRSPMKQPKVIDARAR